MSGGYVSIAAPRDWARTPIPTASVVWLGICCLLVFCTIILGGAVRLSGAGLSIVEWQPLSGIIPPLNDADWLSAFEKYQQFPEFQILNPDLDLAGFQFIYWMEYAHRLLGRIIGVVFLLPFLFFLWQRSLPPALRWRLAALFCLGALQGLLGWFMVKSGLVDAPRVSHYRLAIHFMLAVLIYTYMLHLLVGMRIGIRPPTLGTRTPTRSISGNIALALILLMLLSGVLVAGTHAGQIYNTWPQMGDTWIPPQLMAMQPLWHNPLENPITIQFMHRWLALLVLIAVSIFAHRLIHTDRRARGYALLAIIYTQITLGIITLLLQAPPALGIAHQSGALLLLTVTVMASPTRLAIFGR